MSSENGSESPRRETTNRTSGDSAWKGPRVRRMAIYAAILLGVFFTSKSKQEKKPND